MRAVGALRFPLQHGYVTVSELLFEGQLLGTISIGGMQLRVLMSTSDGK